MHTKALYSPNLQFASIHQQQVSFIHPTEKHMNPDQRKNLLASADAVGDHLTHAWNYYATLRALQRHARERLDVLNYYPHFVATITYSIWDDLFNKLYHCVDNRKEAMGFPKLFKQVRTYLASDENLMSQIGQDETKIKAGQTREKIVNWRHQVVAHYTIKDNESFVTFYKDNVCSLNEIKNLISEYQKILNYYGKELLNIVFMVKDLGTHAHSGVDQIIKAMIIGAEQDRTKDG